MESIIQALAGFVNAVAAAGYPGIFVLMLLASSFLPVPSQAALIPAGYLASQGRLELPVVLICSVSGTLCGALVNYGLALWLGRPFLQRYGRWLLLTPARLDRAEAFFLKHGEIGTFLGRLVTGVRHYVSLPAGVARMPLGRFVAFTLMGGALYDCMEVGIGYVAGDNQELIERYSKEMVAGVIVLCALAVSIYAFRHRRGRRPSSRRSSD